MRSNEDISAIIYGGEKRGRSLICLCIVMHDYEAGGKGIFQQILDREKRMWYILHILLIGVL